MSRILILKPSDTVRTFDATPSADPDLVVPMVAGKRYFVEAGVLLHSGPTADLRYRWKFTGTLVECCAFFEATTDRALGAGVYTIGARPVGPALLTGSTSFTGAGSATASHRGFHRFYGALDVLSSGNFEFHWSQNVSASGGTTVYAGSWIYAHWNN